MLTYENLRLLKRLPYTIYWVGFGALYLGLEELVFKALHSPVFPVTRLVLTFAIISGIPVAATYAQRSFGTVLASFGSITSVSRDDYYNWATRTMASTFSFRNWHTILVFFLIDILVMATLFSVPFPFHGAVITAVVLLLQPFCLLAAHAVAVVTGLMNALARMSSMPLDVPFLRPGAIAVSPLMAFYGRVSFIALLIFAAHYLSFAVGGFAMAKPILIWTALIGFFPFALLVFSFTQAHGLLGRIKEVHLEGINTEVQAAMSRFRLDPSKQKAEVLEALTRLQRQVEQTKDWPVNVESFGYLVAALAAPVAQLMVALPNGSR